MAKSFVKELAFSADAGAPSITSTSGHAANDVVLFAISSKENDTDPSLNTGSSTYTGANLSDLGVVDTGGAGNTRVKFRVYSYEVPDTSTFTFVATDSGPQNAISGVVYRGVDKPTALLASSDNVDNSGTAISITCGTVTSGSFVIGLLNTGADTTTPIVNNGANAFSGTNQSSISIQSSGQTDLSNGTGLYWVESTADSTTVGPLTATANSSAPWTVASIELVESTGGATEVDLDSGSYTLTGNDLDIKVNRVVNLDAGSYTLTGNDLDIQIGSTTDVDLDVGSFSLSGFDLDVKVNRVVNLEAGSFSLSGNDLSITFPSTSKTATCKLVDPNSAVHVNLTGLKWAWFDSPDPSAVGAPSDQGTGEVTDGSGILVVDLSNTTLSSGQQGTLLLQSSDSVFYGAYILEVD